MRIGVPREIFPGEKRVATVPDVVTKLVKLGFEVSVEKGAGEQADLSDDAYSDVGASIAANAAELWGSADDSSIIGIHPRAISIEDSCDANVESKLAMVIKCKCFGCTLSFVITRSNSNWIDVPPILFRLGTDRWVAINF